MRRPFHFQVKSIRGRLVLSYVLLTLMTVTLMGGLALFLVSRYVQAQHHEFLTANAEAIAQQARPLVWPIPYPLALHELAHTTAFLGNLQVRILDAEQQVLADSNSMQDEANIVWVSSLDEANTPTMITLSSGKQVNSIMGPVPRVYLETASAPITAAMPISMSDHVFIQVEKSVWGNRISFPEAALAEPIQSSMVVTDIPADFVVQDTSMMTTASSEATQIIFQPIGDPAHPIGFVELSSQADVSSETLATAQWAILLAGLIAMLTAAGVGLFVSQEMTESLAALTEVATQMGQGNLAVRAAVQGADEIGQLGQQFNTMAAQLEASFSELATERDTLRRFMADASHELYTPITALKTFNHLLQHSTPDPTTQADFLTESQLQINRLDWIIRNLLDLSRLDAGLVKLDMARHEVSEILIGVAAPYQRVAQHRGLTLIVQPPVEPVELLCDVTRLELALANLLDNALKFTPTGGQVILEATVEGQAIHLSVMDTGLGITADDIPHIFERFYRSPANNQIEGSGLGLAIVQAIIQAHHGQIIVTSEAGQGSRFTVILPLDV